MKDWNVGLVCQQPGSRYMEKGSLVKDIMEQHQASGIFMALEPRLGQGRNGAPYWSLKLSDSSGAIDAKIWHPLSAAITDIAAGCLVQVSGHASLFRDQKQFVIEKLREIGPEEKAELRLADFMRASPYGIDEMFGELKDICKREFSHGPWARLVLGIVDDPEIRPLFSQAPAAKTVHHAYAGGLLEHTLSVASLCRLLADKYAELDRQTLLAGAILHDIGKIRELSACPNTEYTREGKLLGHIFLGLEIIDRFLPASGLEPELCEHLRHLVLSHHGELEFGAARLPQTAEAFALHYADNIDAKLAQCRTALEGVNGSGFGAWQATLNRGIFRALSTPAQDFGTADSMVSLDGNAPPDRHELFFEDKRQIAYGYETAAADEPPLYADSEIPAEEQDDGCEDDKAITENRHGADRASAFSEESGAARRGKAKGRDAQCSLLMRE